MHVKVLYIFFLNNITQVLKTSVSDPYPFEDSAFYRSGTNPDPDPGVS
jgi:hypothetical protein